MWYFKKPNYIDPISGNVISVTAGHVISWWNERNIVEKIENIFKN